MTFFKFSFALVALLLVSAFSSATEVLLPVFQDGQIEYQNEDVSSNQQVLVSAPKRVANALRIEAVEKLGGTSRVTLLRIDVTSNYLAGFEFYKRFIQDKGSILFECKERACGSSNYWANTILNERKLYGRDSDQAYIVGRLGSAVNSPLISVYAVKNGRKQHYLYIKLEQNNFDAEGSPDEGVFILNAEISDSMGEQISSHLKQDERAKLWVLCSSRADNQSTAEAFERSAQSASQIVSTLYEKWGIAASRVGQLNLGPFFVQEAGAPEESNFCYLQLKDN